jgi:uncharacterized protein
MRRMVMLLIRGYQLILSPLFPPCCRFIPSCSEYAKEALERHGLAKGLALTGWRVLRCQPFCTGGLDPVPDPKPDKSPAALNRKNLGTTNLNPRKH